MSLEEITASRLRAMQLLELIERVRQPHFGSETALANSLVRQGLLTKGIGDYTLTEHGFEALAEYDRDGPRRRSAAIARLKAELGID